MKYSFVRYWTDSVQIPVWKSNFMSPTPSTRRFPAAARASLL
jgi:hypothetical protein